jgi:ribosomal protein L29
MKRIAELRQMSDDQLKARFTEINNSLRRGRGLIQAGHSSGHPKDKGNAMYMRKLKKDKARILTILSERERIKNAR